MRVFQAWVGAAARRSPALLLLGCSAPMVAATADESSEATAAPTGEGSSSSGASGSSEGGTTTGDAGALLFVDGFVFDVGVTDLRVIDGKIAEVGELTPASGEEVVDLAGKWVTPAFIDSHVHLLYLNEPMLLAAGGVAAGVDMAAPPAIFEADLSPMRVIAAGPMVTAIDGYPTESWGANGYGIECADAAAAEAAVEQLADLGAAFIKLPVMPYAPQLDDEALAAAVERAHELGLLVASHATSNDTARQAALAGADILAHTPTQLLADATVALWADRTVVSTVQAFGGSSAAIDNLTRLREAGARVLYGTDFGNSSVLGVDPLELAAMVAAGMTPKQAIAAGTSVPAGFWQPFDGVLGALSPGMDASFLVTNEDPLAKLATLGSPSRVYVRGVRVDPG